MNLFSSIWYILKVHKSPGNVVYNHVSKRVTLSAPGLSKIYSLVFIILIIAILKMSYPEL